MKASKVTLTGEITEVIAMLKGRFPENSENWDRYHMEIRAFQQALMARNLTPRILIELDTAILSGTKEEIEFVQQLESR